MPGLRLIVAAVLAVAGGAASAGADLRIDGRDVIPHLADRTDIAPHQRMSNEIATRVCAFLPGGGGTWTMQRCFLGPMKAETIYRRRAASLMKRAAETDDEKRRVLLLARAADWQKRVLALRVPEEQVAA